MIDINRLQEAITLAKSGEYDEAERIYLELLKNNSENFVLLSAYGILNFIKRNFEEAADLFEKALNYAQTADVYNQLVACLFEIKNYPKAVEFANKMYELYPDDRRAIAHKIKALTQSGKLLEAEELCVESLKQNPDASVLWFHLGFLKELIYCDDRHAKECYKAAAELGNPDAYYNIAVSAQKLGEFEEAEAYYTKMLEIYPDDDDATTSLGMCYLTQKRFKQGYDLFFKRDRAKLLKRTNNPLMPNEEIPDELIVMCDQGFGDHIQFIRYIPFLKASRLKVAAPKALTRLFKQTYPDIEFIDYEEINPDTKFVRVTDLAYILGMDFDHIPFAEGYLKSGAASIENSKLKVGLCWEAGNAGIRTMINRTIHVKCFEEFFKLEDVQVYSFQVRDTFKGNEKYPQMINLAKDFKDFADTAKALKAMDVVVTVDTSVAHLAGALGVKTYLLIPYAADWRWFGDTETTPWYKSVRIFKQTDSISWEEPLKNIMALLKK